MREGRKGVEGRREGVTREKRKRGKEEIYTCRGQRRK